MYFKTIYISGLYFILNKGSFNLQEVATDMLFYLVNLFNLGRVKYFYSTL